MATQADIEAHYDEGNDFFEYFLDKRHQAYSTGNWDGASTLEEAQQNKFELLSKFAHITEGDKVLDIGCGWGGFLNLIASKYQGAQAHGLTISTKQFEYITQANNSNVNVHFSPWQKHMPVGEKYDALVSVEVFEHFATFEEYTNGTQRKVYDDFFDWCLSVTTDDAYFALQTIIITRLPENMAELKGSSYLREEVFPGSAISTMSDIQSAIVDRYEIADIRRIGADYVKTLKQWDENLVENKDIVIEKYSEDLFNHFRRYFKGASDCFETGYFDLVQLSLKRVKPVRIFTS